MRAAGTGRLGRRPNPARRAFVLAAGSVLLVLLVAEVPLAALAHQGLEASGGSLPGWLTAGFGLVGFVVALRKPENLLAWALLGMAFCGALSEDASFYAVADFRLHHGALPLGWVALLAQPFWAPALVSLGLVFLLFPDGRPPSRHWRWVLWLALAVGGTWIASAFWLTVGAITGHHLQVDPSGNLVVLENTSRNAEWWNAVTTLAGMVLLICWLGSLAGQALSYRRSSPERRQQLKCLLAGCVVGGVGLGATFSTQNGLLGVVGLIVPLVLPLSIGIAVLRYRLFDIERVISRTLAYAIVTGALVGLYAGMVVLATQVLRFHSSVAVAAATLVAAALFHPLRRRVQRTVDRRFNRARYDADRMVAAFAARLRDAVDMESVQSDLIDLLASSLEPAHASVWISRDSVPSPGMSNSAIDLR
jgi:hypothetical protein